MINVDDETLLQQALAYDRRALTMIYDRYQPLLYPYIYRRVNDGETARELTAVVFQRLLQTLRQGGELRHLRAWLYRTAHNLVIDHYRRRPPHPDLPLTEQLRSEQHNPEQLAAANLRADQLHAALTQLTPAQQQVIALKFFAGFTNAEIADVMDKPIGAVKSLQHRGLASLERLLTTAAEKVMA